MSPSLKPAQEEEFYQGRNHEEIEATTISKQTVCNDSKTVHKCDLNIQIDL